MGLDDRDYVRDEPRGFNLGGDWSAVAVLIAINIGVYFLNALSDGRINDWGALRYDLWEQPWQAWQLLTYGWLHDDRSLQHLLGNMLGLYFFGGDAEESLYSRARFYKFYLTSLIICGLGQVLFSRLTNPASIAGSAIGASGAISALMAYSILKHPTRTLYFYMVPVPAWVAGLFWLGMDLGGLVGIGRSDIGYFAHLTGAVVGAIQWKFNRSLGDWIPTLDWKMLKRRVQRPGVRLHRPSQELDEPDDDDLDEMRERMDQLLEKISLGGRNALTNAEQAYLNRASQVLRERQRR